MWNQCRVSFRVWTLTDTLSLVLCSLRFQYFLFVMQIGWDWNWVSGYVTWLDAPSVKCWWAKTVNSYMHSINWYNIVIITVHKLVHSRIGTPSIFLAAAEFVPYRGACSIHCWYDSMPRQVDLEIYKLKKRVHMHSRYMYLAALLHAWQEGRGVGLLLHTESHRSLFGEYMYMWCVNEGRQWHPCVA